jgi:ubiquinone/menaquinone biosynthesis C-methylase UbiE
MSRFAMNSSAQNNHDEAVVRGFGDEWTRFPQATVPENERRKMFQDYFNIFPWEILPKDGGVGSDIGCGSGRWAMIVGPHVRELHLVDASVEALEVAKRNLGEASNIKFHHATLATLPFADQSLDFAYSLGVLHHVPHTEAAIGAIATKLKKGAPLLLYLYYAFDNRPTWYRLLWKTTEAARWTISRLPYGLRYGISELIAFTVYWPITQLAKLLDWAGILPHAWPLAYYRDKSVYTLRTDALDRFGTRLEKRFTRAQITAMLENAGFEAVRFSERPPYWCAVAIKARS